MKVSFRSLPLKDWTIKFCWLLPKIILYLICLYLFYTNVKTLTSAFFRFNTTVVIRYETPETIYFPGLTICGCSLAEKFCDFSTLGDSDSEIADLTVRQVLTSYSFPEHYLVSVCHFIYDSRQPEFKVPCSEVEPPLASLQNGRRCLTYFTRFEAFLIQLKRKNLQLFTCFQTEQAFQAPHHQLPQAASPPKPTLDADGEQSQLQHEHEDDQH